MMPNFNPQQRQEILLLIQQGRKVEAVKWVKDHSDLGLKEAKDYVKQAEKIELYALKENVQIKSAKTVQINSGENSNFH